DEDLLWELSDQLEPEDGKLWVCDIDGAETPRLHPRWHRGSSRNYQGSDRSRRLISRRVYRGAQRMLTIRAHLVGLLFAQDAVLCLGQVFGFIHDAHRPAISPEFDIVL